MIESNDPGRPDLCKELVAPAFDVAWHVAIANHLVPKYTLFVPELKPFLDTLFEVITPFAHAAMVVTIAVFVRMGYRTKRVPALGVGADPTSLLWVSGLYRRLCGSTAPCRQLIEAAARSRARTPRLTDGAALREAGTRLVGSVADSRKKYGDRIVSGALDVLDRRPVPPAVFVKHQHVNSGSVSYCATVSYGASFLLTGASNA